MKGVDTIARIRREFFIRGRSIKEIVRDLHVSRNTVRKVVRTGRTAFEYEREVQPMPKLGQWRADLDELLAGNDSKAARERLTMIREYSDFVLRMDVDDVVVGLLDESLIVGTVIDSPELVEEGNSRLRRRVA